MDEGMDEAIRRHLAGGPEHVRAAELQAWGVQHGGSRQRAAAAETLGFRGLSTGAEGPRASVLAASLMERFGWGQLSAPAVQEFADAARRDGLDHAEVTALSKIGSSGAHPKNCFRDLRRMYRTKECQFPKPLMVEIPFYDARAFPPQIIFESVPVILAHELAGFMFTHYENEFKARLLGSATDKTLLEEYWDGADMDRDPRFSEHPVKQYPNFRSWAIPCSWHGDGVPYKKAKPGQSLEVMQWGGCLSTGTSTFDTNFFWSAIPNMKCLEEHGLDTYAELWRVAKWDWEHAAIGMYPSEDPWGKPWPVNSERAKRAGTAFAGGLCDYCFVVFCLSSSTVHGGTGHGF